VAQQVGQMFLPQVFGPHGEAPTPAQQEQAQRAHFTADNQPAAGVERVNPAYPPPPGTPEQIEALQEEIANLLAARAHAEQTEQQMAQQEAEHRSHQEPLIQTVQETGGALTATQAHQQSVERRAAVNQEQQGRQQEAQGLVAGYPGRATGMAALTIPLTIFAGFTRFGSILPGDIGASMARMNADSTRMLAAFGQMGATMAGQAAGGPARQTALRGDQTRLSQSGQQSVQTQAKLTQAKADAQALQAENLEKTAESGEARSEAAEQKEQLGTAAAARQEQAQDLARQMPAWAQAHRAARTAAIEETRRRLEAEGHVVREVREQ
jgi:hypothetical protein